MNPHYPAVSRRAENRCEYCRAPEATANFPFEVEHIIPPRQGGTHALANLALACRACNLHKREHVQAVDPHTGAWVALFDPRRERWLDHFEVDLNTATIVGTTPQGRATVARLKMNTDAQVSARRQWMRLCIFP